MHAKYKDVRPGDEFHVISRNAEGHRDLRAPLPAQLGPDDDVSIDRWYGFPAEPHLSAYLNWLEQEAAEIVTAVRTLRDKPDTNRFAEGDLKHRMESFRRVLNMVEFPVLRGSLTGLR